MKLFQKALLKLQSTEVLPGLPFRAVIHMHCCVPLPKQNLVQIGYCSATLVGITQFRAEISTS